MQLKNIIALIMIFILCSCTTVRHKSISRTYHGTNGYGGHWMLWRMPNKTSGDSVAISASGFNVSRQEKVKTGLLAVLSRKDTTEVKDAEDYGVAYTKIPPGRYQIIYQPLTVNRGIRTHFVRFNAGDSIALQVNLVNVERHFHENWRAKYMSPAQKEKHDKKVARLFERLDKIKERGNYKKYFRLRRRKAERWGFYY